MGFSYRKSPKMGPVRLAVSKSGISYSAGVKGAHVTKRADGWTQTTLSVPGTGMRYTTTRGTAANAPHRHGTSAEARQQPDILPGQRYSMLPAQPPPGISPLAFKGYLASVILTSDSISISRKLIARLTGNRSVMIPWPHLVAVDFLEPTRLVNGHIHFAAVADPRG